MSTFVYTRNFNERLGLKMSTFVYTRNFNENKFVYTRNFNERLGLKVSLINVDICLYKKL